MIFKESETVEPKAVYADGIKKEISAFANTRGGTIYIGVEDDGTVCGVAYYTKNGCRRADCLFGGGAKRTLRPACRIK